MLSVSHIEDAFKRLLQRDVNISLNKKTLKQGKLTLFALKGFYLNLKLLTPTKKFVLIELPFPFAITDTKTALSLSYKPLDFAINSETTRQLLSTGAGFRKTSKLLNSEVIIEIV